MLELRDIRLDAAGGPVLAGLDLAVPRGQLLALLGPPRSGKSSLLQLAAGRLRPTRGQVRWEGAPVDAPGARRAVALEEGALLPWPSLRRQVEQAVGLSRRGGGEAERRALTALHLSRAGLSGEADRLPGELSAAARLRGALARAFALGCELLLLDEPFRGLAPAARRQAQALLLELWAAAPPPATLVLATRDAEEAALLADRVVVLRGPPAQVAADLPVPLARPRRGPALRSSEHRALAARIAAAAAP